ncbi:MAG: hypothetical protein WC749_09830 [Dehalococcoidia bacterium]
MYNIEKDVPIPRPCGRTKKYPYEEMEVGDSFFVPEKLGSIAHVSKRLYPKKFSMRFVDGGTRIWRIE